MPFKNPLALLGLLSVVPLIILYLIRPRPRNLPFSSLLFLTEGEAERSAVVRRLITDPLFWIQLIILVLLATAAAGPYTVAKGVPSDHLIVVVDVSASMEESFPRAVEMATSYVREYGRVSIVLAENVPQIALQEGSSAEAVDALRGISPKAVSADISGAMLMAGSLIGAEGGKVLVVSDFISFKGDDPGATRKVLEANGAQVIFEDSGGQGDNVAVTGGWIVNGGVPLNYTARIQNFGGSVTVPVTVKGPGGTTTRSVGLAPGQDYYLSFDAWPGVNTISLDLNDAIASDNVAYVYAPVQRERRVLYNGGETAALAALESLPNVAVVTSGGYENFDVVVLSDVALSSEDTAGSGERPSDGELNRYIDRGGSVIYLATNQSMSPQYLPVTVKGYVEGTAKPWVRSPEFAEDIHFEEIGIFGYPLAEARRRSTTVVEVNGNPVLSHWQIGNGRVVYDALDDGLTDFYLRPEYPIFWYLMINWLTGVPDVDESNRQTGDLIPLGEATEVDTPGSRVTTASLLLDQVGVYRYQGRTLVANLYDPIESNLEDGAAYPRGEFTAGGTGEKMVDMELAPWLIALAALMVLLELAVVRWRREI